MALPDKVDGVMVKKILGDINMDEKYLEEAITTMKEWLIKRPHLPKAAQEDSILKAFIIGCKSVERAKAKLDNYFTNRLSYHSLIYPCRDPHKIDWTKACLKSLYLPGMTPGGHKVCLLILPDKNELPNFDVEETIKVYFMILDSFIREYYMSSGLYVAFDMSNMCVEYIMKLSLSLTSAGCKVFLDSYPHRLKGILSFNAPPLAQTFFSTFITPFLSNKIKKRIRFHSEDHKSMEEYFPIEMLPSDYDGGKSPSIESLLSSSRKKVESERDWFLNEGSETVNEHLRPLDDTDELKGTFRKLQID